MQAGRLIQLYEGEFLVSLETSITQLRDAKEINQSLFNVCSYNGLLTLSQLQEYYFEHGHFRALPKCGAMANHALVNLCNKYSGITPAWVTVEGTPTNFENLHQAKCALNDGRIDMLILVRHQPIASPHGSISMKAKVGWCIGEQ